MTAYLFTGAVTQLIVPGTPPADMAVAPNFERFDGLEPLDHPAAEDPDSSGAGGAGSAYGWDVAGHSPRPGQADQPMNQVYTPGPLAGVVGVLGGQPLPNAHWRADTAIQRASAPTLVRAPSVQWRLGVGQRGPSELGVAQTVTQSEITNNPPQPGDLTSILAGIA